MKKTYLLLLTLTLLATTSCGLFSSDKSDKKESASTKTEDTAATESGVLALAVNGTQLVDETGEAVVLQGISFGWHNWWGQFWNEGVVETLVNDWHAEVIRAAMGVEPEFAYLEKPEESIEKVITVVDAAIANDVYVIIDWHSHGLRLEEAKEFFKIMATKYKGVKNVIYEIFNEPHNKADKKNDYTWAQIKDYSEQVIDVIREIEKDAVILVGTPRWSTLLNEVAKDPLTGYDNIMYVFHFYAASHKQEKRDLAQTGVDANLPIFVSECGGMEASGDGPIDMEQWTTWLEWMDERSISWVAWSVSAKVETCSMITPEGNVEGGWSDDMIKPWGKVVKDELAKRAAEKAK